MNRLEAQHLLFAPAPARLQLQRLEIPKAASQAYTINVWRNHAIEPVLSLVGPYLAFGGWNATFTLGAYDDTLSFTGHNAADLELVWLDSSRYAMPNWTEWLQGRLLALRGMSKAPIVVATWLQSGDDLNAMQTFVDAQAATYWADLEAISNDAAVPLVDARTAALAGTPIASGVHALIARTLAGRGCRQRCCHRSRRSPSISTTPCIPEFSERMEPRGSWWRKAIWRCTSCCERCVNAESSSHSYHAQRARRRRSTLRDAPRLRTAPGRLLRRRGVME